MAARKKKKATGEESTEEIIILCHPVGVMPGVPGSRRLECSSCRQMVWLSPATEQHVAGKKYRVMCDECVSKEADDDIQLMPAAEGQIAEMLAAIPGITREDIAKRFPARNAKRRKDALESILRDARRRRHLKN